MYVFDEAGGSFDEAGIKRMSLYSYLELLHALKTAYVPKRTKLRLCLHLQYGSVHHTKNPSLRNDGGLSTVHTAPSSP
jgi:hypothetical protein